jgi:hypothetical protein
MSEDVPDPVGSVAVYFRKEDSDRYGNGTVFVLLRDTRILMPTQVQILNKSFYIRNKLKNPKPVR